MAMSSWSPSLSGPELGSNPSSATLRKMTRLEGSPFTRNPWTPGELGAGAGGLRDGEGRVAGWAYRCRAAGSTLERTGSGSWKLERDLIGSSGVLGLDGWTLRGLSDSLKAVCLGMLDLDREKDCGDSLKLLNLGASCDFPRLGSSWLLGAGFGGILRLSPRALDCGGAVSRGLKARSTRGSTGWDLSSCRRKSTSRFLII